MRVVAVRQEIAVQSVAMGGGGAAIAVVALAMGAHPDGDLLAVLIGVTIGIAVAMAATRRRIRDAPALGEPAEVDPTGAVVRAEVLFSGGVLALAAATATFLNAGSGFGLASALSILGVLQALDLRWLAQFERDRKVRVLRRRGWPKRWVLARQDTAQAQRNPAHAQSEAP
jgi:hypothetical protein